MLRLENLSLTRGQFFSVEDVSLSVAEGEFVGIIGPNGAGKSTLFNLITGQLSPTAGRTIIAGKCSTEWKRRPLAKRMAVVGQTPHLSFDFTVKELVSLGRAPHRDRDSRQFDTEIISAAIHIADLDHLRDRFVPSLSGGERQRAFFAKALAQIMTTPEKLPGAGKLLLLDEPTSALDLAQQARILGTARKISESGGSVLCILHDLNLAAAFADRLYVMSGGHVVASGAPNDILTAPNVSSWYNCEVEVQTSSTNGRKLVSLRT